MVPGPGISPQKPNGSKRTFLIVGVVAGLAAVIATTATITWKVARQPPAAPDSTVGAPAIVAAAPEQQSAAKKRLCELFDAGTIGQAGKGGVIKEGQLNLPMVLRMVNTGAAVNSALVPEVPSDVAGAAREYVARVFALTTEALGRGDVAIGSQLNTSANNAIDALLDACGLPR